MCPKGVYERRRNFWWKWLINFTTYALHISRKNNLKCPFECSKQSKSFAYMNQWEKKLRNKITVLYLKTAFDFELRHLLHVPISVLSLTLNSVTKLFNYFDRTFYKGRPQIPSSFPPLTHPASGSFLHRSL